MRVSLGRACRWTAGTDSPRANVLPQLGQLNPCELEEGPGPVLVELPELR